MVKNRIKKLQHRTIIMKKILLLLLITTNLISQNSDYYMSTAIKDDLYHYFEGLGSKRLESKSECGCKFETETSIIVFLDKSDNHMINDPYLDTLILDSYIEADDILEFTTNETNLLKKYKVKLNDVSIDINIKRKYSRFNIFRFRYKLKYKVEITYNYNQIK